MSVKHLKQPQYKRQAEQIISKGQSQFTGMCYGEPLTKIGQGLSYRNINLIDRGEYKEVRPGTLYHGLYPAVSDFTGYCNNRKRKILYILYNDSGTSYLYSQTATGGGLASTYTGLTNRYVSRNNYDWSGDDTTMVQFGKDTIVADTNSLNLIYYDETEDVDYAYKINIPVPAVLITDVAETATKIYIYRYIYSFSRIIKGGDTLTKVDRLASGATIELESGTSKTADVEKDYGEVAFTTAIDDVAADPHVVGTLTCPAINKEATHYSVYRTKNIGQNSGGVDPISGVGNNQEQYIWVDDAPIAAAYVIDAIDGGTRTLTTTAGSKEFEPYDVGCTLEDTAGNTGVIEQYVDENNVILTAGYTLVVGTPHIALGNGRVMSASQATNTITRTAGGTFVAADIGRPFFWSDGGMSIIASVGGANTATTIWSDTHAAQAGTIADATNGFTREYNDTTIDDGGGEVQISINDRIGSGKDIYIPPRFFEPLPNGDIVVAGYGFVLVATRDSSKYYYSQIGAKKYWLGCYRADIQYDEAAGPIRNILRSEGEVYLWAATTTETLLFNVSQDVGNSSIGESIQKLQKPYLTDPNIGCYHYATIRETNRGEYLLLTAEPAIKLFRGSSGYDPQDRSLAVNGQKGVSDYLKRITPDDFVVAAYTPFEGYLLYCSMWDIP